ncbi:bifunctional UDP-N-acetylglucosamine diphosphorylase/glucosamine-1-phosphate N-acetyltransferase GlmU [Georgenia sp. Z1344]|uniref:bifunctional UDP-N-acetylglucosamine diphosphorylase/glucosamine-1-phosphate N-acetyltransferase GlmU n=1 Tax=Georgenia sp. Z1344 TaxID=3416706 RepID=UPI003CF39DF8
MTQTRPAAVVVLAAGAGTRMRSATPKVLHAVGGRTLLGHALTAARQVDPERLAVVVRHERERVAAFVTESDPAALLVDQDEIPGTGRAVQCALDALDAAAAADGSLLVMAGDTPLLDGDTLAALLEAHAGSGNAVTVLTAEVPDPFGYGRILRDGEQVVGVVEERDATDAQRAITEINTSTYVFEAAVLREALAGLGSDNDQGEVYLTDVVAAAHGKGLPVRALKVDDPSTVEGINDRVQLAATAARLNDRLLARWMRAGVTIVDPGTTWIDVDVELARDVTILPGTQLHGTTVVAEGATVGPETTLTDCEVGPGAKVVRTHAELAVVRAGASVGPFAYLRPGTVVGDEAKVGTFVELKNSTLGRGAKVPHLSYVGDADIGEGTNIGAASVFVNYDGVHKHRSTIGAHARTGADNMFVAPVQVGDGAYTGAGTIVRHDVPAGALALNDFGQKVVEGWVERKRPGTAAAEAASAANGSGAGAGGSSSSSASDPEPAAEEDPTTDVGRDSDGAAAPGEGSTR